MKEDIVELKIEAWKGKIPEPRITRDYAKICERIEAINCECVALTYKTIREAQRIVGGLNYYAKRNGLKYRVTSRANQVFVVKLKPKQGE